MNIGKKKCKLSWEGNPRVLQDQEIVTRNILAITWAPPIGRFMPVIDSPRRRKPMSCNAQFRIFPLQLPAEVPLTIWGRGKNCGERLPNREEGEEMQKNFSSAQDNNSRRILLETDARKWFGVISRWVDLIHKGAKTYTRGA